VSDVTGRAGVPAGFGSIVTLQRTQHVGDRSVPLGPPLSELKGRLASDRTLTVEEMNDAIAESAAEGP
jgi:hypothetical protein